MFWIMVVGAVIGYFLNNYILTVDENEKGKLFGFAFDKLVTPAVLMWNILIPVILFKVYYYNCFNVNFFRDAILSALCSAVFFIDFRLHIIPNILNLIAFVLGIILTITLDKGGYADVLTGAGIGLGFFLLIIVFSKLILKKDGMGLGDAKLMCVVGLMFGRLFTVAVIFLSFIFASVGAIIALVSKKKEMGQEIAFGPYIVMATMVMIFFGNDLLTLYLG